MVYYPGHTRVCHKILFQLYLIMPFQSDEKSCLAEIMGHLVQNSSSDKVLAYVVNYVGIYIAKSGAV